MNETVDKFDIQKLTPPDTSSLPKIDFSSMLALKVAGEDTLQAARSNSVAAREFITAVGAIFDEPTSLANRLHKWFTGMRSKLLEPAQKVDEHSKREIQDYLHRKEQERLALERKLQAEAEQAAKAAAAKATEALDPFELMEKVDAPPPAAAPVPAVHVAPESHSGVGLANKPWSYEVTDKRAFVEFILANWDLLEGYLLLDDAGLKAQAKRWQAALGDKFPGLKGIRQQRVSVK